MRTTMNAQPAVDVGLLAIRAVTGGLLAGHGAQKLFGSFGGHGLEGTGGWLESLGLRPGTKWALLAGGSELGAGTLTALGLLHPLGSLAAIGPMVMAWATAHHGKPIWVTSGGAELPLVYLTSAVALLLTGPGRLSLDQALDIDTPVALTAATALGVAGGIAVGLLRRPKPAEAPADEPAEGPEAETAEGAATAGAGMGGVAGDAAYGGMAAGMDPDEVNLEAEVGGDPPGAFGFNLRGASDRTGTANDPEPPRTD